MRGRGYGVELVLAFERPGEAIRERRHVGTRNRWLRPSGPGQGEHRHSGGTDAGTRRARGMRAICTPFVSEQPPDVARGVSSLERRRVNPSAHRLPPHPWRVAALPQNVPAPTASARAASNDGAEELSRGVRAAERYAVGRGDGCRPERGEPRGPRHRVVLDPFCRVAGRAAGHRWNCDLLRGDRGRGAGLQGVRKSTPAPFGQPRGERRAHASHQRPVSAGAEAAPRRASESINRADENDLLVAYEELSARLFERN